MYEFTGLRVLHQNMKEIGETRAIFPFKYNEKEFSCIFLVDIIPFRLYLTTLGIKPIVFELEIEKGYKVQSYLDDYNQLVTYLELKYNPNHVFKPNDFFEALNRRIPIRFTTKPNYKEVLLVASKRRKIEEDDKIYFCGWYSNPIGKQVRPENLEKTRSAFGDKKAEICSLNNISSCWTNIPIEENLSKLDDIESKTIYK